MRLSLKCCECSAEVAQATIPENIADFLPPTLKGLAAFVPKEFKLDPALVASVLKIRCTNHKGVIQNG